jgi:hypothetical protein
VQLEAVAKCAAGQRHKPLHPRCVAWVLHGMASMAGLTIPSAYAVLPPACSSRSLHSVCVTVVTTCRQQTQPHPCITPPQHTNPAACYCYYCYLQDPALLPDTPSAAAAAAARLSSKRGSSSRQADAAAICSSHTRNTRSSSSPRPLFAPEPSIPGADSVQAWVVFSDLHVSSKTLDASVEVLRRVHEEARRRQAGVLFLGGCGQYRLGGCEREC